MGRTKSPVLNARVPPKPGEAAQASEAMEAPSTSFEGFSSAFNPPSCPTCGFAFLYNINTTDLENHVASCTGLSPPPQSPSFEAAKLTAMMNHQIEVNPRAVVKFDDGVENSPVEGHNQPTDHAVKAQAVTNQNDGTSREFQQITIIENPSQAESEKSSNGAVDPQAAIQEVDKEDFAMLTISPYVDGEYDEYSYEIKDSNTKEELENDLKDDENGSEDPKAGNGLKAADEQDDLADPVTPNNEIDSNQVIEEDIYGADDTPRPEPATEPATPQVIEDDIYGLDTPRAEPATPQVVEEDMYAAESTHPETPTPVADGEVFEGFNVNGAEAIKASEALSGALLGTVADVNTLGVPANSITDGPNIPQPNEFDGVDLAGPSQSTLNTENRAASDVASQVANGKEEPKSVIFKFRQLRPVSEFAEFLKEPSDFGDVELYHRTANVADALTTLQEEFDAINQEIYQYEQSRAFEKELAEEEKKKANDDKKKFNDKDASAIEEDACAELFVRHEPKLRLRGNNWLAFLAEFEEEGGDPKDIERLKKMRDPGFVNALGKRKRTLAKESAKPQKVELVNGDLPSLSKKDREPHFKRRKIIQDRVVFDEKKQADVYQQSYNAKMTGNQKLLDRKAANFGEIDLNENGRPKRRTAQRAFYDTEQSDTAPDTETEALPAKRSRRPRVVDDGIASPGRPQTVFESRDGTPARVFPSGKRVGRPPGSKTKNPGGKAAQSKLNTVQVAEPSESEADDGQAENEPAEFQAQELEPAEEEQLQAAASSLVAQTVVEANAATSGPVKKKHAGGRPKKNIAIEEPLDELSTAPAEEGSMAAKPKNKGGRPRKYPLAADGAKARGGRAKKQTAVEQTALQIGEEEEVMQSTEHDNESMFPSTSTSRPTTSSSGGTDGTFGGRPTRRTTRGKSQAQSVSVNPDDQLGAPGPSVSTNGRGKRNKRTTTEDIQPGQQLDSAVESGASEGENIVVDTYRLDLLEEASPPKKPGRKAGRAKKGKAIAQSGPQPVAPQEDTPELAGDASNTTGRPKRKRAAALPPSSIDPDQLGEYLSDDDGETPPPSKRRNARGGRKGKPVKREQSTDLDSGIEGDSSVPPSRKRAVRAVTKKNAIKQETATEESSGESQVPQPPKTRKSRTNTLIIAEGAGPLADAGVNIEGEIIGDDAALAPKKRPVSRGKQAAKDVEIVGENIVPKKRKLPVANKGKVVALGDMTDPFNFKGEGMEAQEGNENAGYNFAGLDMGDAESVPPAKRRRPRTIKSKAAKTESTGDDDFEDSEDYTGMDPAEAEVLRKKKRKSKKLAAATKARWANGTMKGPMEKRKATNAAKKAAKLAVKVGGEAMDVDIANPAGASGPTSEPAADVMMGGMGGDGATDIIPAAETGWKVFHGSDMAAPAMTDGMAPARTSTRVRKPTSRAMGLDGADDYSDDEKFKESEYDRFQALSSPKGGVNLSKRARKSYIGLDDEDSY